MSLIACHVVFLFEFLSASSEGKSTFPRKLERCFLFYMVHDCNYIKANRRVASLSMEGLLACTCSVLCGPL